MVEIFRTDVRDQVQAERIQEMLLKALPEAKISFDLEDRDSVLRVENTVIDTMQIISLVSATGTFCKLIPDKICPPLSSPVKNMEHFWDSSFKKSQAMWGYTPAKSAIMAKDFFLQQEIKQVLIPGIGYGRNAAVFIDNAISVTGIEISKTAIDLANTHFSPPLKIFYGSATDMPFDKTTYDGIFCHGLLYLLNEAQRKKMLNDCYNQLNHGGWMIFTVISKSSPNYGLGMKVAEDTYEIGKGGQLFFYDYPAVKREFESFGVTDIVEMEEPSSRLPNQPGFKFFLVKCQKQLDG